VLFSRREAETELALVEELNWGNSHQTVGSVTGTKIEIEMLPMCTEKERSGEGR